MALFRPRFLRLATYATVLALSIHFVTLLLLPPNSPIAGFVQVSIAAVALGTLIGIILADYRRGGSLMKRVEEEVLVIAIFGLFWLSFATILRVFGKPLATGAPSQPMGADSEQREHEQYLHQRHQHQHQHQHQQHQQHQRQYQHRPPYQPSPDYEAEVPVDERFAYTRARAAPRVVAPTTRNNPVVNEAAQPAKAEPLRGVRTFVIENQRWATADNNKKPASPRPIN